MVVISRAYQKTKDEVYEVHWRNCDDAYGWEDERDKSMNIDRNLQIMSKMVLVLVIGIVVWSNIKLE